MRAFLRLVLVVSLLASPIHAKTAPVTLGTLHSAVVGMAPLIVRFHATVDPDEHNRQLCFSWDSATSSGQGCTSMDGERAPVTYWRDITFRTGGEFTVSARVERNDGRSSLSNIVIIRVLSVGA